MFEWPSRVGVLRFLDILYTTNQSHGAHTTLQLLNMVAQCNGALLRDQPGWSEVGCLHHHQLAGWRALYYVSLFQRSLICLLFFNTRGGTCWIQTNLFIEGVGSGSSNLGSVLRTVPPRRFGPPGLNIEMSPCVYRMAAPLCGVLAIGRNRVKFQLHYY